MNDQDKWNGYSAIFCAVLSAVMLLYSIISLVAPIVKAVFEGGA